MTSARPRGADRIQVEPGNEDASAAPAAACGRVAALRENGGSYRSIAQAAGLAPMTVHAAGTGRARPRPATAAALLAVTSDALTQARVDAGGTRLRLRALHVMGHGSARIARASGASPAVIRNLVRGDTASLSSRLHGTVTAVYDTWWDKRAPARTPAERSAAARARSRAIRGDWCAAAALDDDELDIPGYQPSQGWRPALGTGVAADIPLPAPRHKFSRSPASRPA